MRLVVIIISALTGLLLGSAADAATAPKWAPRMERMASCSWDRPGHNPFMGDVVAAIDRYVDIPTLVRIRLKQRMQLRQYDDLVDIRRDEISGRERYEPEIRDMHFGLDRVCRQVTRARWTAQMHERGLVYCEEGHCILVPTVCRNVSRIERKPSLLAGTSLTTPSDAALDFEAPSAGPADTSSDAFSAPPASDTPTATSSSTESVESAGVPPWGYGAGPSPSGGIGDDHAWPPAFGPGPWWPTPSGGGAGVGGPLGGGPGFPDGGGFPGGGGIPGVPGGGGGGGGSSGGGNGPIAAVPEPATWLSLLGGCLALAFVSVRQRRQRRAAPR